MDLLTEAIIESIMECDLTQNDATVYLWLLKHRMSNPSEISKGTGIQRPRVYDSLKRLIEKGFVIQEIRTKRHQYTASDSENLLNLIQSQIDSKIEARDIIKEQIIDQFPTPREKGIFFFNNEDSLRRKIQKLLKDSQKGIMIMAIFRSPIENETLLSPELLIEKSLQGQDIILLLNISDKNWESCLKLFNNKVKIFHYPHLEEISTIIHIIDGDTLFISVFKQKKQKIQLEYGIYFSGAKNLILAFNFLIQGFINQAISLQERIEQLKKTLVFPTETLKDIYGI